MYLHLGKNVIVPFDAVVGVFDLDSASASTRTRLYLERAEREGRLVSVADDIPRSFVVCREGGRDAVYLSQISARTLERRAGIIPSADREM